VGFADPFPGYSVLLRTIVYGLVPAFGAWQFVRLRRALHPFQLEGYKRRRYLAWCRANRGRVIVGPALSAKKPLAMTGRAWRILVLATALSIVAILGATGSVHLVAGWPLDVATWLLVTAVAFCVTPELIAAADWLLSPVQAAINSRYEKGARRKLGGVAPEVIGVTGSFGKTSTKFAVAGLLGPSGAVLATPASYNTPMGVVRAINENLAPEHRWFVVEMGAYGRGDIAQLCDLVHPRVGVLTAIGPAHLERFGSLEAIRDTKYELIASLPADGLAVMNSDDADVRALAAATRHVEVALYGTEPRWSPDVSATDVRVTPRGTEFTVLDRRTGREVELSTKLLGAHAIGHILAGIAVATHYGRSLAALAGAVARLAPVEHRLQLLEGTTDVTVIDDAFNSNPQGAEVALEVLGAMPARRRVIVTPGIIELGDLQFEANRRFGHSAAAVADALIVVADVNREAILAGARDAASGSSGAAEVVAVPTLAEARRRLADLLRPGDAVLFENDLPDHHEVTTRRAQSGRP
jgi:UDP-N-acetylmuramoyl-tripeptide--D-alanyl-D-alanine ligase